MYSSFLKHIILPVGDFIFQGNFVKTWKEWKDYDTLSETELLRTQRSRLEKTLTYANKHVPFYQKLHYDNSLTPVENLKQFPILTKEILRKHADDLVSEEFQIAHLRKNYSSGSSGVQSWSYSEKKNVYYLQGLSHHWYQWGGFEIGKPVLQFGISPKRNLSKKLKDFFFRTSYEEAFTLDEADYQRIFNTLKQKNIRYIIGYPSAINQLAAYGIKNNIHHPIQSIISLGDKLFDHFETNFAKAFDHPKVIDTYGCAEGLMVACRYDTPYYYISAPHVYIEIVDNNGNDVADGELGNVLVTCFTNDAQPFIRYQLGDLAIKLPRNDYPEERRWNYPMLENIIGRETDVVKTPTGKTLIVHSFTGIIEYFPDIKQYQITQEKIDEITIRYIVDDFLPLQENTLSAIEKKINELTDGHLQVKFVKTNHILDSPSGKPQIIQSFI